MGKKKGGGGDKKPNPDDKQPQQQSEGAKQKEKLSQQQESSSQKLQEEQQPTMSGAKKDADKERKAGDWKCAGCNYSNFSKKKVCNKCKAPKPIQSGPPGFASSASGAFAPPPPFQKQTPARPQTEPMQQQWTPQQRPQSQPVQQSSTSAFAPPPQSQKQIPIRPHIEPMQQQSEPQSQPVLQPSTSKTSLSGKMQKMALSNVLIESSPDGRVYEGKRGKPCKLEANYASVILKKIPKTVEHYDVSFDPESPKKFLVPALDAFMRQYFQGNIYAFDGRKNMYTKDKLVEQNRAVTQAGFTQEVEAVLGDRRKKFKVTIKHATTKDLQILNNYRHPQYQNEDRPSEATQVLDIILRSAFKAVLQQGRAVQAGRGLFFTPDRPIDISQGMELWLGLFQSVILGRSKIYLNVDVLHKAFPSATRLINHIRMYTRDNSVPNSLNPYQQRELNAFLSMLMIGYRLKPTDPPKQFGFNGLIEPRDATFTDDSGRNMTVEEYYKTVKGIQLQYPDLPYLWVGPKGDPKNKKGPVKKIILPLEFCEIAAGQATNKKCPPECVARIIRYSATSTDDRKRKIKDLLNRIEYNRDQTVSGFGIEIDKEFNEVDARVIDPPNIKYSNNRIVRPARGAWNGEQFIETSNASIKWTILNCHNRTSVQTLVEFKRIFIQEAKSQRINLMELQSNQIIDLGRDRNLDPRKIQSELEECAKNGYKLVVVVVEDSESSHCYARVKQAAELQVGILTQCIKGNTIYRMFGDRGNPSMTIKNILLKLNAKLGGKNHEVNEVSYETEVKARVMFIGADVTHPGPDSRTIPSVVGVASSYDAVGFKYCCAWRLQDPRMEMIVDLENILAAHLQYYWSKNNNQLPKKIFYYRDGVSDGQFKEVLQVEMTAIRRAMQRIYGTDEKLHARITFVVVQKRHHTRFFPAKGSKFVDGKNNNIVPGTVVDKHVVHPFQYQFFMASHAAIQGVTKPTKYCILVNESKISPDNLQAITYDLCHLFTRCNRSVSYPAPTYYAHHVATRGKIYITGDNIRMDNLDREYTSRAIKDTIIQNAPMFFV